MHVLTPHMFILMMIRTLITRKCFYPLLLYVQLFCTYNIIINKKWSYLHAFNSFTFRSDIKVMPTM